MSRPWRRPTWLLVVEVRGHGGRALRVPVPIQVVDHLLEDLDLWAWLADRWLSRMRPQLGATAAAFFREAGGGPLSAALRLARQILRALRQEGPFTLVDIEESAGMRVSVRLF
ncbi:MAG: hypothetical protein IMW98_02290 [Firmicutes bacterium]|nr:hypothetical protein [Bacillota bacterium]